MSRHGTANILALSTAIRKIILTALFPRGAERDKRDATFSEGVRSWYKIRSKGDKPGLLAFQFESKSHKASVSGLVTFTWPKASLPYLYDKEKWCKDTEAERERGK